MITGNVIIIKGTIVMRGARIDVRQDPEGYQFATVASEPYRQNAAGHTRQVGDRAAFDESSEANRAVCRSRSKHAAIGTERKGLDRASMFVEGAGLVI